MALIVKQLQNKRPVKTMTGSGDPRPKSREHMPRWTKWQSETIERLKADKAAGAEDSRKAARS